MKKKSQPKRPAFHVTVTFETYEEARDFALKAMELPAADWARGIYRVVENYPKGTF